jgi:hypothetical protein
MKSEAPAPADPFAAHTPMMQQYGSEMPSTH